VSTFFTGARERRRMRLSSPSAVRSLLAGVRSSRAALVALAGNSVLLRGLPDLVVAALVRLLRVIPDWVPVVAAALTSVVAADLATVGLLFEWVLFSYLLYGLLPRLLPGEAPAGPVFGERRFRLLSVALTVALAFPLAAVVPVAFTPPLPQVVGSARGIGVLLVTWMAVALAGTAGYLHVRWWRNASADEQLDFVAATIGREPTAERRADERRSLERDDWAGRLSSGLLLAGTSGRVVVVCALLGFVTAFAGMLFPLVEVAVVAGIVAGVATERVPGRATRYLDPLAGRGEGIERRFYAVAAHATESSKGLFAAMFVVFGFVISTFLALLSVIGLFAAAWLAVASVLRPGAVGGALLALWNAVGFLVCLSAPGLYSIWFWHRMATRLPHFLAHWERRRPGTASVEDPTVGAALVTRPPLALAPVTLAWLPVLAVFGARDGAAVLSTGWFALAWPPLVGVVAWTVRWTRRATPQPPGSDAWALPAAMVVQAGWLGLLGRSVPGFPFGSGESAGVVGLLLALLFVPDAESWLRRRWSLSPGVAMLVIAGAGGTAAVAAGLLAPALVPVRPVLAAGAILLAVSVGGYAVLVAAGER
jgi:hypothetical protein